MRHHSEHEKKVESPVKTPELPQLPLPAVFYFSCSQTLCHGLTVFRESVLNVNILHTSLLKSSLTR